MYTTQQKKTFYEQSKAWLKANNAENTDYDALVDALKYHEWAYYVGNEAVIGDQEYDHLYKILETLERQGIQPRPDSPTQRVSSDLKSDFFTVEHLSPMLSLGNSYNAEDLQDFHKQVLKNAYLEEDTPVQYAVEPKFDGGSIALVYQDDYLVRGATRGNGVQGEEMTANAKAMSSIPLKALFSKYNIAKAELRGEAIIAKADFKKINQERLENEQQLFANPRNAATGGLRTKDANETKARQIQTFAFQLSHATDNEGNDLLPTLGSHFHTLQILKELGFKTPDDSSALCQSIEEASDFCQQWEAKRDTYAYEIDGMVVKVNDFALQEKIGYTQHHPKWAIAYKFKAKQATTKLLGVEYQIGKIGSVTPVAKLEPVQLAGVTVSSVSLHNEDFITARDLHIGDTVVVERAGDVIPYIVKALEELRTGDEEVIVFPDFCPANSAERIPLERMEGESAWRCPTCTCGQQDLQKMIFHVSKEAMDIDGFGKSYVEKFFELGWLKDISDIYNLDYSQIQILEGFGEKSVTKLREAIDKAKHNSISKLLHSLSIHHLGKKAGKLLAEQVEHVMDFAEWPEERYSEIKDVGPVLSRNMVEWFANPANIALLNRLESYGVNLTQTEEDKPIEVDADAAFYGKTILFTGTLMQMGRKEAQDIAVKAGAKTLSAISAKLDILVVGENAGSKLKKAQDLGSVTILTEEEFLGMVGR